MKVYVAGPMQGLAEFNFPAFHAVSWWLRSFGHEVFSPAEKDIERHEGTDISKDNPNGDVTVAVKEHGFDLRKALEDDLVWICRHATAICLIAGWEFSKGADCEHALCEALGLHFMYVDTKQLQEIIFDYSLYKARQGRQVDARVLTEPKRACARSKNDAPETAAPPPETTLKPTNPKDALGIKKASMSCIPAPFLMELGAAMAEGALKYGRHNYRAAGVRVSVYYDALLRHMTAFWEGEDTDQESGVLHIVKAAACLAVLHDSYRYGNLNDDRPPKYPDNWQLPVNSTIERLIKKYPTPALPHRQIDNSWTNAELYTKAYPEGLEGVNG